MVAGIVLAIVSVIVGPLIVWKFKLITEKKHEAFEMAVRALSSYQAEGTEPERRRIEFQGGKLYDLSPDTSGLISKSDAFVRVHFSKEVYEKYTKAMSKDPIDVVDFRIAFNEAVEAMGNELSEKGWFLRFVKKLLISLGVSLVVFFIFLLLWGYVMGHFE